ncbi:MAG: hypothetical protein CMJ85_07990 [Planctomycetes bacterium]|jgi:hypothetical protein|nr:hypothetical protein [Planctomycetota bacterium]MDP6423356.1 ABC transporter permease [Planctomycetota bacterium]
MTAQACAWRGHLIALPLGVAAAIIGSGAGAFLADAMARSSNVESFIPRFIATTDGEDLQWVLVKSLGSAFLIAWFPWHLARGTGLAPGELAHASFRAWFWPELSILTLHGLLLFPQLP